jgi:NAD(P)-dependent dehydrogenase (short-subunit alcohol dehydrogenase family)
LLDSVFFGMKHAARVMIPNRSGCILTTSSTAGVIGGVGAHAYTAAKHAVAGLVKSVASELASHGITVNAVAPGATVSALSTGVFGSVEKASRHAAEKSPLGRAIFGDDIAEAFLYLAGSGGRNVSGQTLVVDGGYLVSGGRAGMARFHSAETSFLGRRPGPAGKG